MKKIALIGLPWRVDSPASKNLAKLKRVTTTNTGNMAFAYAISKQLGVREKPWGWGTDPALIRERYDVAVLMAANHIKQQSSDDLRPLKILCNLLEECQLPIVVIGLGSQAPHGARMEGIHPTSARFLHILRDRGAHISIRGGFTAQVLEAQGITNYALTGCPSNFINKSRQLGLEQEHKFRGLQDIQRLAINCDVRPDLRDIVPPLVRWLEERNGAWMSQVYPEIAFVRREYGDDVLTTLRRWGAIMKPGSERDFVTDFFTKYCQYFMDIEQWMEFLVGFDFATGTRLHGNMLAWQAGVPAVWIPHDARTAELTDLMALPHMDRKLLRPEMTIREFMEACSFNGEHYDRQRLVLIRRYCNLLKRAGLELSEEYAWLSKSGE